MASKGDKFIIEIENTYISEAGDTPAVLYKMKGFKSLVFDESGIEKLTPYHEKKESSHGFKVGDEVYNLVRKNYGVVIRENENGVMYMTEDTITWYMPSEELVNLVKTDVRYPEMRFIFDELAKRGKGKPE